MIPRVREAAPSASTEALYRAHERLVFSIGYRMLGDKAEADDVVQETFVRALTNPPDDSSPVAPWLVKVAVNLSRDALRRRKRRAYVGPWLPSPLPSPVATDPAHDIDLPTFEPVDKEGNPEARYDMLESVSFAFLLALELLTPTMRAIFLLRDVFDYSVRETAAALDLSEANVKTSLHRARARMAGYDEARHRVTRAYQERTGAALAKFLGYVGAQDRDGLLALLREDAVATTDGAGEWKSARVAIRGGAKIAQFFLKLSRLTAVARYEIRTANGLPAVLVELADPPPGVAPRSLTEIEIDEEGRVRALYTVVATAKLATFSA